MEQICKTCHEDSTSHSFSKLCELGGVSVFYTKPADATKYTDREGILAHYDNMLNSNGDKPWTWIFDSDGFGMKHALEINTGIGIAKLITSKYSTNLQKIIVKNPTWHIKLMYTCVSPFLSKKVNSMVEFKYDSGLLREK
jgi:hypothetical protein